MPTILITGAASGLGAEFLRGYQQSEQNTIIALDRSPIPSSNHARIQTFLVDVSSQDSINHFKQTITDDIPIDLVIHSAGIRGLVSPENKNQDVASRETMQVMDLETMMSTLQTNAVGTFMLLRALVPNLREKGKVVVMSSRMGSIENNEGGRKNAGGAYAYRASKAALNTIVRSFAVDVPEVVWVLCHPGRVATGLVEGREEGAIEVEESVRGLVELIEGWGREDSGRFYDRFGERLEW